MKIKSDSVFPKNNFNRTVDKTKQFVVTGTKNGDINKGDGNKRYCPDGKILMSPTEA